MGHRTLKSLESAVDAARGFVYSKEQENNMNAHTDRYIDPELALKDIEEEIAYLEREMDQTFNVQELTRLANEISELEYQLFAFTK